MLKTTGLNQSHIIQQLWVGAGLKLPAGKYNVNFKNASTPDLQELLGDVNSEMGTGSLDFIANTIYTIQFKRFGISTTANYKINSSNKSDFKFGDRFTINSFAYYQAALNKTVFLAPNVGVLYEHVAANKLNNAKVAQTGGYAALASAGLDVNIKKITVGANVQLPFAQDYSLGQTQYKARGLVHVTYSF